MEYRISFDVLGKLQEEMLAQIRAYGFYDDMTLSQFRMELKDN
jgi:hypothetical protein